MKEDLLKPHNLQPGDSAVLDGEKVEIIDRVDELTCYVAGRIKYCTTRPINNFRNKILRLINWPLDTEIYEFTRPYNFHCSIYRLEPVKNV